jgi:hypothetical protein
MFCLGNMHSDFPQRSSCARLSRWIGGLIIGEYGWSSTQNCVAKHRSVEGFLAAAVDKTNNHHQRKSMHLDYLHAAPNDTVTLTHRFLPFLASLTP